jgi:hypothetical protein
MGIESLCSAVANAVKHDDNNNGVMRAKVSGNMVQVSGRSYSYTVAVDIQISDGEWVYVAIVNNRAVVVGK